jgi:hypothetical protein
VSAVHEALHWFDSSLIKVLGLPLVSNSAQESHEEEVVQVSQG